MEVDMTNPVDLIQKLPGKDHLQSPSVLGPQYERASGEGVPPGFYIPRAVLIVGRRRELPLPSCGAKFGRAAPARSPRPASL